MSVVFPKVGGIVGTPNYLGAFTWANKPTASSSLAGATAYITDIGIAGGSYWYCDGVRWRAVGGSVTLISRAAGLESASGSHEVLDTSNILPPGAIQNGDLLDFSYSVSKNNNVATSTIRGLIGTTGTTSDDIVFAVAQPATTNTSAYMRQLVQRVNSTTIRKLNTNVAASFIQTSAAFLADTTLAGGVTMDADSLYVSISAQNTSSELTTLMASTVRLLT
jgi:hypothetical protein